MSKINSETYTGYRESPSTNRRTAVDASTDSQAIEAQPADVEAETGAV